MKKITSIVVSFIIVISLLSGISFETFASDVNYDDVGWLLDGARAGELNNTFKAVIVSGGIKEVINIQNKNGIVGIYVVLADENFRDIIINGERKNQISNGVGVWINIDDLTKRDNEVIFYNTDGSVKGILRILKAREIPNASETETFVSNPYIDSNGNTVWDCVWFGNYYQTNTTKKEPIKWRVLNVNGNDAFLLSDQILDVKEYNEVFESITWERCTLRSWLNGYDASYNDDNINYSKDNFIDVAFDDMELEAVLLTTVKNNGGNYFGSVYCNNTIDKIFLLSKEEVIRSEYGFCDSYEESNSRVSKLTEYYLDYTWIDPTWWLRSQGNNEVGAETVDGKGCVFDAVEVSYYVNNDMGVRPALHLNLNEEDVYSYAGTVCSDGTVNEESGGTPGTIIIPGKETHYGIAQTEKSEEEYVKEAANEFVKAENEYISAINSTVKTGINTSNTIDAIKEKDQSGKNHILTLANAPDDAVYAGYAALAEFFEEYKETTPSIGEIDISANIISIEAKILNTIRTQFLRRVNVQTKYGKYTAKITGTFAGGAFSCGINISGNGHTYTGVVNSEIDETKKVMASYLQALGNAGEDVLKQGLRAYLKDFARYTCISDFTQETMNDALSNVADYLQSKNWGKKVLEYGVKLYDGYDIVKSIVKAENDRGLVNSLSNAENIYQKVKSMSYTDFSVKDKTVKYTMDKIEKARVNLEDALWDYIYHTKSENGTLSFWDKVKGNFKKITGHCPVDFVVYSENGDILGTASDGYCEYDDNIYMEVSDDVKTIYVPSDMNIRIEMTGTDIGAMTYVVEQYENNLPVGRSNYYDIPLTNDSTYSQIISSGDISTDISKNIITTDAGTDIKVSEYISVEDSALVDISCIIRGQGSVLGTGNYAKGDAVEIVAFPDEGYYFDGWYDGETLVGIEATYRLPALNDKEIKAVFSKKNKLSQTINCELFYALSVDDKPFNLNVSTESNQIYYSSADEGIVKVDGNGNVSIIGVGNTKIYVLALGNEDYDEAVKMIDITVSETSTENIETTSKMPETSTQSFVTTEEQTPDVSVPKVPKGLQGILDINYNYNIFWETSGDALYYNIYVNNELIGNTVSAYYCIPASVFKTDGNYIVGVEAVNANGTSDMANIVYTVINITETEPKTETTETTEVTTTYNEEEVTTDTEDQATESGTMPEMMTTKENESQDAILESDTETSTNIQSTNSVSEKQTIKNYVISNIKTLKSKQRAIKVSWKKKANINGYQIQYSTSVKFKTAKKITIKKAKATSKTIKNLRAKKKYYIRIRTYIVVNGKKYYSNWSKKKSKKTK